MSAQATPTPRRVTIERISALVQRYAALQGLGAWRFTVSIVPGLTHQGAPAWAVVDPDPMARAARVMVRDIDATPIPNFDGDPLLELRVTIAHELFHCVVAEAMAGGSELTVPAEEKIVETAAQAMVRSEGLDARVMARAVRALPSALRARVAARAPARARGGQMDPEKIKALIAAIKEQNGDAALQIAEEMLVEAASAGAGGAPPHAEPDGDEVAKVADPPAPGGTDGGAVVPPTDARRAKEAEMSEASARARKAAADAETYAAELKAMVEAQRPAQKEQLISGLRARLGAAFTPAAEKAFIAEIAPLPFPDAQKRAAYTETMLGGAGGGSQRARSNVEHEQNPGPERPGPKFVSKEDLLAEGHSSSWVNGYIGMQKLGADHAQAYLEQGRTALRARKAQNGAAS